MHALLPSLLAGFATALGSLIVLIGKNPSRRTLALMLGGAAGVMLAVVLLDLLPASLHTGSPLEAAIGFGTGLLLIWVLDIFMNCNSSYAAQGLTLYRHLGYLIATGIALHDLPEGIAIAGAYAAGGTLGPLLAISIALHNIPEGIATAAPLKMGGLKPWQILAINLIISLFTPLGTILGLFILSLSPQHLALLLALAAGAMTYLIKDELIPAALHQSPVFSWLGLACGYLILWFAQYLQRL